MVIGAHADDDAVGQNRLLSKAAAVTERSLRGARPITLRQREVKILQSVGTHSITTGHELFDKELVFLQLRRSVELITFASLLANKEK